MDCSICIGPPKNAVIITIFSCACCNKQRICFDCWWKIIIFNIENNGGYIRCLFCDEKARIPIHILDTFVFENGIEGKHVLETYRIKCKCDWIGTLKNMWKHTIGCDITKNTTSEGALSFWFVNENNPIQECCKTISERTALIQHMLLHAEDTKNKLRLLRKQLENETNKLSNYVESTKLLFIEKYGNDGLIS